MKGAFKRAHPNFLGMRGQQGIGTILILIAIVLAAVIASVLIIQSANELKTQALNVQKEHESLLMDRLIIKEVDGVTAICDGNPCITHLILTVSLAPGASPFDLRKTYMSVVTDDYALEGVRYVKPEDLYYEFNVPDDPERPELAVVTITIQDENSGKSLACRAELINIMRSLAQHGYPDAYDITHVAHVLDPYPLDLTTVPPDLGTFYTVLWTDCGGKGDTQTLLPDQEIKIFYRLRKPLAPSSDFTLKIGLPQGTPTTMELRVPRGFQGKLVTIYP